MADPQYSDLPPGAQVVSAPQAPTTGSNPSQQYSDIPQGAQVVQNPSTSGQSSAPQQTPGERSEQFKHQVYSQAGQDFSAGNYRKAAGDMLNLFKNPDEKLDFLKSAADTSGVSGVSALLSQEASHRVNAYHKAIESVKKGDWQTAVNHAYAAIAGGTKDDPLYEAAKSIITAPWEETKKAYEEAKKGNIGEAAVHAVGAVPIIGPGAKYTGEKIAQDIHEGSGEKVAGDIAGFVGTLGFGKGVAGEAEEGASSAAKAAPAAETVKPSVRPSTVEIAGEKVPVSTPQMANQGLASKVIEKVASKEGAQEFINKEVQPAAAKATQSNFSKSALKDVENLEKVRGDEPSAPPKLDTVDDIADHMRNRAKDTYSKLDEAAVEDHKGWEIKNEQFKQDHSEWEANRRAEPAKYAKSPEPKAPPEPKSFTDLQTQINDAEQTIRSKMASVSDKGDALEALPQLKKQMTDFLKQHKDVVGDAELGAADKVWANSKRYDWIGQKMRSATTGTEGTASELAQKPLSINPKRLESMPAQFDNQFGEGSFRKLLGDDGMKNYNDIQNVLRNPIQRSKLQEYLTRTGIGVAGYIAGGPLGAVGSLAGKFGLGHLADNLLFNPEFGQRVLKGWRETAGNVKGKVSEAASQVTKPTAAKTLTTQGGRSLGTILEGASQPLSEGDNQRH